MHQERIETHESRMHQKELETQRHLNAPIKIRNPDTQMHQHK
jgi:hypothetical protein